MIGRLRQRVTLQQEIFSSDEQGGQVKTYADLETAPKVYAQVEALGSRALFSAYRLEVRVTHRIIVRYRSDIKPGMRVKMGDRAFDIVGVMDRQEERRFLEILAEERGL